MSTQSTKRALHRRSARRGAALVEAAVVIPVMLVFTGLIMWSYKSYGMKLDRQMEARASLLYYASHSCVGQVPTETASQSDQTDAVDKPGQLDEAGGKLDPNTQAGLDQSFQMVHARPADTDANGTVINDRRTFSVSRRIHAEAETACNEKRFDNDWTAVFQYIGEFARTGGGFIH